jgi:hypothetical protein
MSYDPYIRRQHRQEEGRQGTNKEHKTCLFCGHICSLRIQETREVREEVGNDKRAGDARIDSYPIFVHVAAHVGGTYVAMKQFARDWTV